MDVMELKYMFFLVDAGVGYYALCDGKKSNFARPANAPDSRDVMELECKNWTKPLLDNRSSVMCIELFQIFQ